MWAVLVSTENVGPCSCWRCSYSRLCTGLASVPLHQNFPVQFEGIHLLVAHITTGTLSVCINCFFNSLGFRGGLSAEISKSSGVSRGSP